MPPDQSVTSHTSGGIMGDSNTYNEPLLMKNCTNYGAVTYVGGDGQIITLGGIVGNVYNYVHIENCVNMGEIVPMCTSFVAANICGYAPGVVDKTKQNKTKKCYNNQRFFGLQGTTTTRSMGTRTEQSTQWIHQISTSPLSLKNNQKEQTAS